jgi:hypothetical protein
MRWPDHEDQTHQANTLRTLLQMDERLASINRYLSGISLAVMVIMGAAIGFALEHWWGK